MVVPLIEVQKMYFLLPYNGTVIGNHTNLSNGTMFGDLA